MSNFTKIEDNQIENICVSVRVRPLFLKEQIDGNREIVSINTKKRLIMLNNNRFKFDHVFGKNSTQIEIFQTIVLPIIENCLNGYNGVVLVYGQSGSGKRDDSLKIIPNTFQYLFKRINRSDEKKFTISISYFEICDEELRDLLAFETYRKLEIKKSTDLTNCVDNLERITVDSVKLVNDLFVKGNENRSAKSHTIFRILFESSCSKTRIYSKLNLVDLADNENSQHTLDDIISILTRDGDGDITNHKSNLTRLLQDSLGGNSKTLMIATISPTGSDNSNTVLQYASRLRNIKVDERISSSSSPSPQLKKYQRINLEKQSLKWQTEFKRIEIEKNLLKKKISIVKMNLFKKEKQNFDQNHKKMLVKLRKKSKEQINIKQNYSDLVEEDNRITQEIDKTEKFLDEIERKSIYNDHEYQRDLDSLENRHRFLLRKIQLATMFIRSYIPGNYLKIIEGNLELDNQQDLRLINGEFVGNKFDKIQRKQQQVKSIKVDVPPIYQNYSNLMKNNDSRDDQF